MSTESLRDQWVDVPTEAIDAAMEAIAPGLRGHDQILWTRQSLAEAAVRAAAPIIRAEIAEAVRSGKAMSGDVNDKAFPEAAAWYWMNVYGGVADFIEQFGRAE